MTPDYEDIFLSDVVKQMIGLYRIENPNEDINRIIAGLDAGRLKELYCKLSKGSREIINLPVIMLFRKEVPMQEKAIRFFKYRYYNEEENEDK